MLFTTPGLNQYISGVIVYDETLRSNCEEGVALVRRLQDQGIVRLFPDLICVQYITERGCVQG